MTQHYIAHCYECCHCLHAPAKPHHNSDQTMSWPTLKLLYIRPMYQPFIQMILYHGFKYLLSINCFTQYVAIVNKCVILGHTLFITHTLKFQYKFITHKRIPFCFLKYFELIKDTLYIGLSYGLSIVNIFFKGKCHVIMTPHYIPYSALHTMNVAIAFMPLLSPIIIVTRQCPGQC